MSNLVTGGSGFLGHVLVEQLVARGEQVRVFCRSEPECLALDGVSWFQGDMQDASAVSESCQGIQTVYHCAGLAGIWGPWSLYESINVQGTRNLLQSAMDAGATRLVFTSSPSVVFDGSDMIDADETIPLSQIFSVWLPLLQGNRGNRCSRGERIRGAGHRRSAATSDLGSGGQSRPSQDDQASSQRTTASGG